MVDPTYENFYVLLFFIKLEALPVNFIKTLRNVAWEEVQDLLTAE